MFGNIPSNYEAGQTLGQYIRVSRLECGLTLRAFAKILGVSPSYWSDVERDKRTITERRASLVAWELSQRIAKDTEKREDLLDDKTAWLVMYHHLLTISGMMNKELKALLRIIEIVFSKGRRRDRLARIQEIVLETFFEDLPGSEKGENDGSGRP